MTAKIESIEIDGDTAAALKERAAKRGVSVSQLVAELVPLAIDGEAIERGQPTVPHAEVERWLRTWGSPDFRPWNKR